MLESFQSILEIAITNMNINICTISAHIVFLNMIPPLIAFKKLSHS